MGRLAELYLNYCNDFILWLFGYGFLFLLAGELLEMMGGVTRWSNALDVVGIWTIILIFSTAIAAALAYIIVKQLQSYFEDDED